VFGPFPEPRQSGFQPTVEPTGCQPVVVQWSRAKSGLRPSKLTGQQKQRTESAVHYRLKPVSPVPPLSRYLSRMAEAETLQSADDAGRIKKASSMNRFNLFECTNLRILLSPLGSTILVPRTRNRDVRRGKPPELLAAKESEAVAIWFCLSRHLLP
jgi:hypothetical protein